MVQRFDGIIGFKRVLCEFHGISIIGFYRDLMEFKGVYGGFINNTQRDSQPEFLLDDLADCSDGNSTSWRIL